MSVSPVSHPPSKQPPGAGPWEPAGGFGDDWWREVKPLAHAMVYKVREGAVLKDEIELPSRYTLESWWPRSDRSTLALLASESNEPQWAPDLREVKYDLFVAHLNDRALPHLLFLTSSRHSSDSLYRLLAEAVLSPEPATDEALYEGLEVEELKRIYSGALEFEFINLGMDVQELGAPETYSSVVGHELRPATGAPKEVHTGHAVGSGIWDGKSRTLGFSHHSKVWSPEHLYLQDLVQWCDSLAARIQSPRSPLPARVNELPD